MCIAAPAPQRKGRKDIGHQIEVKDLQRQKRCRQPTRHGKAHHQHLADIARHQVDHEIADIAKDHPALPHGKDDGRERIVAQDHMRGLLGHFSAAQAHGDADIGLFQRGCVVHTIARHGHDMARLLIKGHERHLDLGCDPRKDIGGQDLLALRIADGVDRQIGKRAALDHLQRPIAQPSGQRDGLRGVGVIARQHHDPHTGCAACRDGLWHIGPDRVTQADKADQGQIAIGVGCGIARVFLGKRQ